MTARSASWCWSATNMRCTGSTCRAVAPRSRSGRMAGARRQPFARRAQQLDEYFAGRRTEFDLPLKMAGSPFQRRVWRALQDIPYGETISYGELARRVGEPRDTAQRRHGQRPQPDLGDRPVPPRDRRGRQPHGLRRRPGAQADPARARSGRACPAEPDLHADRRRRAPVRLAHARDTRRPPAQQGLRTPRLRRRAALDREGQVRASIACSSPTRPTAIAAGYRPCARCMPRRVPGLEGPSVSCRPCSGRAQRGRRRRRCGCSAPDRRCGRRTSAPGPSAPAARGRASSARPCSSRPAPRPGPPRP